MMRGFFIGLLLIGCSLNVWSQNPNYAVIDGITVEGNKRTKTKVILRELGFQTGDTVLLSELPDALTRSEQLLMNTWLFSQVLITYQDWKAENNHIKLKVIHN